MDVVAYLPAPLLSHLRIVLGDRHQLTPVDGWETLEAVVRREQADIVVLDPTIPGTVRVSETVVLQERYPSVRVVVYTSLTPSAMRMVVELAKHGLQHVVLHRFDDDPRRFTELLTQLPGHSLGELLLEKVKDAVAALPPRVGGAVARMMRARE